MAFPFYYLFFSTWYVIIWGGEGAGVRGSRNPRGVSASFKLSTTKDSKKLMI